MIAPSSPARTTSADTMEGSMRPWLTVLATAVPTMNAAAKLKNAAQNTAIPGESTLVDTTVAMEFALSWKPLMKSKTSATTTMMMTYVAGSMLRRA